jgi:hypothetical protein
VVAESSCEAVVLMMSVVLYSEEPPCRKSTGDPAFSLQQSDDRDRHCSFFSSLHPSMCMCCKWRLLVHLIVLVLSDDILFETLCNLSSHVIDMACIVFGHFLAFSFDVEFISLAIATRGSKAGIVRPLHRRWTLLASLVDLVYRKSCSISFPRTTCRPSTIERVRVGAIRRAHAIALTCSP